MMYEYEFLYCVWAGFSCYNLIAKYEESRIDEHIQKLKIKYFHKFELALKDHEFDITENKLFGKRKEREYIVDVDEEIVL